MTEDEQTRFQCFELVIGSGRFENVDHAIEAAEKVYNWVCAGPAQKEYPPGKMYEVEC